MAGGRYNYRSATAEGPVATFIMILMIQIEHKSANKQDKRKKAKTL